MATFPAYKYSIDSFTIFDLVGYTTDPKNKMEVLMKAVRVNITSDSYVKHSRLLKKEIAVYKNLKKGQHYLYFNRSRTFISFITT